VETCERTERREPHNTSIRRKAGVEGQSKKHKGESTHDAERHVDAPIREPRKRRKASPEGKKVTITATEDKKENRIGSPKTDHRVLMITRKQETKRKRELV